MLWKIFWKILGYIPWLKVLNIIKGILPSIWAFYFLKFTSSYSSYYDVIERYIELYNQSIIFYFILYYLLVYAIFYKILDFFVRLILLKTFGGTILSFFKKEGKHSDIARLREMSHIKSKFLNGMGLTVKLGYLSKKEIIETEDPPSIPQSEIDQALHELGNMTCNVFCVIFHLLLTLLFVYEFSWILILSLILIVIVLVVLLYSSSILVVANLNSIKKIKKEITSQNL